MNGIKQINECIRFIEEHLEKKLEIQEIADLFGTSKFHFQRMFLMITGYTVAEYIRNRRLTMAAQELNTTKQKVIDVAYKYGYETPESFAKAFRNFHGITPTESKKPDTILKAFPPLFFTIEVKGEQQMDYKILEKEAFQVVGKSINVTKKDGENLEKIPAYWTEINTSETGKTLARHASTLGMLGICMDFTMDLEAFTYFIGIEKGKDQIDIELEERTIPASTWAVFNVEGSMPNAIQKAWQTIFTEWLPATGYEHAGTPEMEVYPPSELDVKNEKYRTEIWLPIRKRG
ncbi:AraC family transcriptional regulator [Salirhabdus sp. Marseille-P4669]|uniref:AraC family transcriptional regulator n=1 Tax=Salirhabdus sp. Marseille-P4669 TaxID=2042310 RepID=UPI001F3E9F9B|nr:AraC family transcriptional regulator [Salirhabdus sp. Marseille-P4669]